MLVLKPLGEGNSSEMQNDALKPLGEGHSSEMQNDALMHCKGLKG